jgi:hypothetical protein
MNQIGKQDKSYYFNGTALNFITYGYNKYRLNFRDSFTINMWINAEHMASNRELFGSKSSSGSYYGQFYLNSLNKLVYDFYTGSGISITCNNILLNNTWYMITLTNIGDSSGKTMLNKSKIYINGTECSSYSYGNAGTRYDNVWNANDIMGIYNPATPTSFYKGYIDTFSVFWLKTMTASNINYLYNSGRGLKCDFSETSPNNNATSYNFTNYRSLIPYNYTYPLLITALNDTGSIVEQASNLLINNLSINTNFTTSYVKNILFNNISSNFYLINITNVYNNSVYLETNISTYRLLTNFTIGEDIVHYPLYIDFNITMNLSDNSLENMTNLINVSVYNLNTSTQSYFNLTRTQGVNGGE